MGIDFRMEVVEYKKYDETPEGLFTTVMVEFNLGNARVYRQKEILRIPADEKYFPDSGMAEVSLMQALEFLYRTQGVFQATLAAAYLKRLIQINEANADQDEGLSYTAKIYWS